MTNHAHILLRSSEIGLSGFMRFAGGLTGYAISYNRRHRRWGHLFKNRYKWIICDEDAYVKAFRRSGERELSVDRILGSGELVEKVIIEAEGKVKY